PRLSSDEAGFGRIFSLSTACGSEGDVYIAPLRKTHSLPAATGGPQARGIRCRPVRDAIPGIRPHRPTIQRELIVPLYENVFIARQDASPAQVEALTENFAGVIAEHGGTVGKR